ncbi:hypothetical protein GGI21_005430, partial [Coemansia aciculifera]
MFSLLFIILLPAVTLGRAVPRGVNPLAAADERIIGGFISASNDHPYAVSLNIT